MCVMEYVSDKAIRETIAMHTGSLRKGLGIEIVQFTLFFQRTQVQLLQAYLPAYQVTMACHSVRVGKPVDLFWLLRALYTHTYIEVDKDICISV